MKGNERGSQGYLHRLKIRKVLLTAALFVSAVVMFVGGQKMFETKANIFTIMAVLTMLPAAKGMVAVIVTFPYHSVSAAIYEEVAKAVPQGCQVMTDMLISSPEKLMYVDFAVLGGRDLICLVTDKKGAGKEVQNYLSEALKIRKFDYRFRVTTEKEHFLREIRQIDTSDCSSPEEEQALKEFILSLVFR